jgi:hypothetical protein
MGRCGARSPVVHFSHAVHFGAHGVDTPAHSRLPRLHICKHIQPGIQIACPSPEEEQPMPIAKITGQGLAAIAFSVGLLWTSVIAGHVAQRNASTERARVVNEVRRLQRQRTAPVSDPSPLVRRRPHVTAG